MGEVGLSSLLSKVSLIISRVSWEFHTCIYHSCSFNRFWSMFTAIRIRNNHCSVSDWSQFDILPIFPQFPSLEQVFYPRNQSFEVPASLSQWIGCIMTFNYFICRHTLVRTIVTSTLLMSKIFLHTFNCDPAYKKCHGMLHPCKRKHQLYCTNFIFI